MAKIDLSKKVYGINTYQKAVNTGFTELVSPVPEVVDTSIDVSQFFEYYDQLFFSIPVSGSINSHTYLVERSQEYIGGAVLDAEKQALIEEINALRQQLLDINQNFSSINNVV